MRHFFRHIFCVTFLTILLCSCLASTAKKPVVVSTPVSPDTAQLLMGATVRLGVQSINTGKVYNLCSATAIKRHGNKYEFLTSAHCVVRYHSDTKQSIPFDTLFPIRFVLIFEADGDRERLVVNAELLAYGDMSKFFDLAIIGAELDMDIPLPPLYEGNEELSIKEELGVVVSPVDLEKMGNLYLVAYVSRPKITVTHLIEGVDIKGAFVMQVLGIGMGAGASGSAVMSVSKNAIVGVISSRSMNHQFHVTITVCPISKFFEFYAQYQAGKLLTITKNQDSKFICESFDDECAKVLNFFVMQMGY